MIKLFDKLEVAETMLEEAEKRLLNGVHEVDFIVSVLLSGACLGVVVPLLKEHGVQTAHEWKAGLYTHMWKETCPPGTFNKMYNSLKHAGNRIKKTPASRDLTFESNLEDEARYLLKAAKKDFKKLAKLRANA